MDVFASCKFSNYTNDQQRQLIKSVELTSNVSELRQKIVEAFGLQESEFDIVYCGRHMRDCSPLSMYQISDRCTVHVVKRVHHTPPSADALDEALIAQVMRAMRQIVKASASRAALERVISNPETLSNLMRATPSLAADPVAQAIFQDKEMLILSTVADKQTINRMLAAHPSLGHAALHLASTVNEEVLKQPTSGASTANPAAAVDPRVHYGLDLMSDEEDEDDDDGAQPGFPGIAAAGGGGPAANAAVSHQITADFFRQAMQIVYSGSAANQPVASSSATSSASSQQQLQQQQQSRVTEAQLEQLRDMGIMDEALARRALEMTGGDIRLALEYIFGDDSMS